MGAALADSVLIWSTMNFFRLGTGRTPGTFFIPGLVPWSGVSADPK